MFLIPSNKYFFFARKEEPKSQMLFRVSCSGNAESNGQEMSLLQQPAFCSQFVQVKQHCGDHVADAANLMRNDRDVCMKWARVTCRLLVLRARQSWLTASCLGSMVVLAQATPTRSAYSLFPVSLCQHRRTS